MVSMLQVIDNPHQDIPLAAVLLGPMFSLTEDELAVIRMENRTADLYDAILTYDTVSYTQLTLWDLMNFTTVSCIIH